MKIPWRRTCHSLLEDNPLGNDRTAVAIHKVTECLMRRGPSCTPVRAGGSFALIACRGYWLIGGRFEGHRSKGIS